MNNEMPPPGGGQVEFIECLKCLELVVRCEQKIAGWRRENGKRKTSEVVK
jgi:hypothetical protein